MLTQGRKFTAKSERDVICGKTLLFFHEVITGPWVEWLARNKRAAVQLAQCPTLLHSLATHANDRSERCADVKFKLKHEKYSNAGMCVCALNSEA